MSKIKVGILGATGMAGQRYLQLLQNHPMFQVSFLAASSRSAGKSYSEAVASRWILPSSLADEFKSMPVADAADVHAAADCKLVFSALDTQIARELEPLYAQAGKAVVSNASAFRGEPDVPVVIPEINSHHLQVIEHQRAKRGWSGFIVTKPNCSIQSYLLPTFLIHRHFAVSEMVVNTMQAVSGAGFPGLPVMQMMGNVVPFIAGEERKSEQEPLKILGSISSEGIQNADFPRISAHCNRVPTMDGHMACVSLSFAGAIPSISQILQCWQEAPVMDLPLAPKTPLVVHYQEDRPQVTLDRDDQMGMAVHVGRLRACPVHHIRFVGLSHNTLRGAAGGGLLIAELLANTKLLE